MQASDQEICRTACHKKINPGLDNLVQNARNRINGMMVGVWLITWDQYETQILRISWVMRGSDKALTNLQRNLSCLKKRKINCKTNHLSVIKKLAMAEPQVNLFTCQESKICIYLQAAWNCSPSQWRTAWKINKNEQIYMFSRKINDEDEQRNWPSHVFHW